MIKKLEELKKATDKEVLQCYEEAQGHTGEFQKYFQTNYSYGMITSELTARGYIQGWHKPKKTVEVKMSKNNSRMNLSMTKECEQAYKNFTNKHGYAFVHTTAALMNYMSDCEENSVEVKVVM